MANSSALKKLKKQKTVEAPKKAPKPSKSLKSSKPKVKKEKVKVKESEVEEVLDEENTPPVEEIMSMKVDDLNYFHSLLPEELDDWSKLDRNGKREALVEALHEEEMEDEDDAAEDVDVDEEDEDSEVEAEVDAEADEVFEEEEKVVEIKSKKGKSPAKATSKVKSKGSAKQGHNSGLEVILNEIVNLKEDEADREVFHLKEDIEYNSFKLGGVLARIKEENFIGEYDSFREKVEAEFGMKYRKAEYLISIYNNIIDSEVPWEALQEIGWTKLSVISEFLTPDNYEEWIEMAKSMNVVSLKAEAKKLKESDSKAAPKKSSTSEVKTLSFKVHADEKETIEAAVQKSMEENGTEFKTVALEAICLEYLSGGKKSPAKPLSKKQFFKNLVKEHEGDPMEALGTLFEETDFEEVFGINPRELDFESEE